MNLKFRWWGVVVVWLALGVFSFAQTAAAPAKKKHARPAPAATQDDVQALRDLVQSQQKQIEAQSQQMQQLQDQLHQVLDAVQQANTNSQKGQSGAEQAQATATQAQQSATEAQHSAAEASTAAASAASANALLEKESKKEQTQLKGLADLTGRFRFSGDVRLRFENYTQNGTQDRNRVRVRVRLGLEGKLNEDFLGGVALATGSQGDPTTTNETLTNVFDRKTIALDKAFITYNPGPHKWLSLTGGKFPYLWQRTSVTGDPDLNPEGFDQKFSFDIKHGLIKNFTVQAL